MNAFIRSDSSPGAFDGVVDFDAATRDPARKSGGYLHPNDLGYRVMGDSVDLSLFR